MNERHGHGQYVIMAIPEEKVQCVTSMLFTSSTTSGTHIQAQQEVQRRRLENTTRAVLDAHACSTKKYTELLAAREHVGRIADRIADANACRARMYVQLNALQKHLVVTKKNINRTEAELRSAKDEIRTLKDASQRLWNSVDATTGLLNDEIAQTKAWNSTRTWFLDGLRASKYKDTVELLPLACNGHFDAFMWFAEWVKAVPNLAAGSHPPSSPSVTSYVERASPDTMTHLTREVSGPRSYKACP